MISLGFDQASPVLKDLADRVEKIKPEPIYYFPYLERVLTEAWEQGHPEYPMEVKLPKPNKYLLKGDFEPAQVIRIEKPIMTDRGQPMWFENTMDQAWLRFGYSNLDARFISTQKLNMEYIHAFLGGASGHGKSVTLNSMMASLFYEYPPWELEVVLSDAKIVEFKKYGTTHLIPHISTIAATEDSDYVDSVLARAEREMTERAKIFANIGASNLKSFRKKTGLAYPRVVIVMDEVESTFRNAGRKAGRLAARIDAFARLGRAAGYHIFMATQNMSSDIPKSAVGQIRVRLCLGCSQNVSESILGNGGAAENYGHVGKVIANTEVLNGGNTYPHNIKFQTPYLDDDKDFPTEMEELERKGRESGYKRVLAFYDENDVKTIETFDPIVDAAIARMSTVGDAEGKGTPVVLGYPAFVTEDPDGLLKIRFDQKDIENVVLCSTQAERVGVFLHIFEHSLKHHFQILHYSTDEDMFAFTPSARNTIEVRDASVPPLTTLDSLVRKRLFLAYADNIAKNEGSVSFDRAIVEEQMRKDGIPQEHIGNSLMCRRAAVFYAIGGDPQHAMMWKPVAGMFKSFKDYYNECVRYKAIIEPITIAKFTKVVYFLGDLSKIIGYGRDNKSSLVTPLKKLLQDANRAGVLFVLYSRSLENLNELSSGLRYAIFDVPDAKDWGRLRTEAPMQLQPVLAVLYDVMNTMEPQLKFKRTLLREEF